MKPLVAKQTKSVLNRAILQFMTSLGKHSTIALLEYQQPGTMHTRTQHWYANAKQKNMASDVCIKAT